MLENQYNIIVLYACEAGSRAWGYASPDSDFDVRFIYRHKLDFYLSLHKQKDTIDPAIQDNPDMGGWDIQKALLLLQKSNIPLLEWVYSTITYLSDENFDKQLQAIATSFFSPITGFYHYQSMAKKHAALCDKSQYKLKHLFYALRTACAAYWITQKQNFPPVDFTKLLGGLDIPVDLRDEISRLVIIKAAQNESYLHPADKRIVDFLYDLLIENEKAANNLKTSNGESEVLNNFYKAIIKS